MTPKEAIERALEYVLCRMGDEAATVRPWAAEAMLFSLEQDGFEVVPKGQMTLEEQIQREFG